MAERAKSIHIMRTMWHISGRLGNQMFQWAYVYAQARRGLIPNVYVQDEKFFEEFKEEIRQIYGTNITPLPYVSIHVRRGDYVNNDFYIDLFANGYYERAIALFPGERFMVFSDDIEWCKKQPIFNKDLFPKGVDSGKEEPNQFLFSEGYDEIQDMNRMAGCKAHIIANSSYSWWAAYISGKETVAPKDWYTLAAPNDGQKVIAHTALPSNWIKV